MQSNCPLIHKYTFLLNCWTNLNQIWRDSSVGFGNSAQLFYFKILLPDYKYHDFITLVLASLIPVLAFLFLTY